MVELVEQSRAVVMTARSNEQRKAQCVDIFSKIVSCVMEARAEFCHNVIPQLFVLKSADENDYFKKDKQFTIGEIEKVLAQPEQMSVIISESKSQMESSQLSCLSKLIHWYHKYPLDFVFIFQILEEQRELLSLSNIGIVSYSELQGIVPSYITKEKLVQLEYCQEITLRDVRSFTLLPPSPKGSFLFFPALLSFQKSEVSWRTPSNFSYSIGWLAQCPTPFPPSFSHTLLLRLALTFTLVQDKNLHSDIP